MADKTILNDDYAILRVTFDESTITLISLQAFDTNGMPLGQPAGPPA